MEENGHHACSHRAAKPSAVSVRGRINGKQTKGLRLLRWREVFSLPLRPRISTSLASSPISRASMAGERKCEGCCMVVRGCTRQCHPVVVLGPFNRAGMNLWGKFRTNRVCELRNTIIQYHSDKS